MGAGVGSAPVMREECFVRGRSSAVRLADPPPSSELPQRAEAAEGGGMGWSEIGEEKQVVLSEPLAELVGGGRNAKYVKECFELHMGRKGAHALAGPAWLCCWDERSSIPVHVTSPFTSTCPPSSQSVVPCRHHQPKPCDAVAIQRGCMTPDPPSLAPSARASMAGSTSLRVLQHDDYQNPRYY